jgi:hypothetical protein
MVLEVRVSIEKVEPERFPLLDGLSGLSFGVRVHREKYECRYEGERCIVRGGKEKIVVKRGKERGEIGSRGGDKSGELKRRSKGGG